AVVADLVADADARTGPVVHARDDDAQPRGQRVVAHQRTADDVDGALAGEQREVGVLVGDATRRVARGGHGAGHDGTPPPRDEPDDENRMRKLSSWSRRGTGTRARTLLPRRRGPTRQDAEVVRDLRTLPK